MTLVEPRTTLTLVRLEEDYAAGTFGVLLVDGQVLCWTLEPRDEENVTNVSSIPAQQYTCQRITSPRYGETFQVMDVPDRTNVLFHWGNWQQDTLGCILLGESIGVLQGAGTRGLVNSKKAFLWFMAALRDVQTAFLTIREAY